ncbi:MAG TPA: response regulator [Kofleriaceae bacterium]|nr:response regulator [Kofleriaceae bacterium]
MQREEEQIGRPADVDPDSSGAMAVGPDSSGAMAIGSASSGAMAIGPASATRRVLVVDDNDESRRDLVRHFMDAGWQVESARAFRAALGIAVWFSPDVIVSELQLPDVRGYRFAADYRRAVPHDVTIFAVTRIPPLIFDSARKAGFDDVFGKPIDFDMLERCIETALQTHAQAG